MEGLLYFARWYYTTAVVDGVYAAGNYSWNILRIFSVRALLRTLFTPYRRIHDEAPSPFIDFSGFMEALAGNILTRIIGFLIRVCVLVFAFLSFFSVLFLSALFLSAWVVLPFFAPYLFIQSLAHLI